MGIAVSFRLGLILILALSASACGGSDSPPSAVTPPSAPYSATDLREGTGATATQGRTVTVSYTGWLYDPTKPESKGTQFDTSANFVFQLGAGRVIGWDQGGRQDEGRRTAPTRHPAEPQIADRRWWVAFRRTRRRVRHHAAQRHLTFEL